MECKHAQPNLLDYGRGLLSPKEADAVRAHLEGCPQCCEALEAEVRLAGRLSAASWRAPVSDVWPLVQSGIRSTRRSVGIVDLFRRTYARRFAAAVAALGILVVVLFSVVSWRAASAEKERVREAAAMLTAQPAAEHDDPLAATRDAVLEALEREL